MVRNELFSREAFRRAIERSGRNPALSGASFRTHVSLEEIAQRIKGVFDMLGKGSCKCIQHDHGVESGLRLCGVLEPSGEGDVYEMDILIDSGETGEIKVRRMAALLHEVLSKKIHGGCTVRGFFTGGQGKMKSGHGPQHSGKLSLIHI